MDVELMLKNYADITETALTGYLPQKGDCPESVLNAVSYSLLGAGKRIRPALTLEFHRICGGEPANVLPLACAVEMIHSYSLIHDDLPCMDNDVMRRGKPSCHVAFGEDTALLAGDALLSLAFETASKTDSHKILPENIIACINELGRASGICGMVGGQILDIAAETKIISFDELIELQHKKTGMMIIAAAKIGCISANADKEKIKAANNYAMKIGRIFQMVDDVLDVVSDEATLGKPVNSDITNDKTTFVSLFGVEKTMEMCEELNLAAKNELKIFGDEAGSLKALADLLLNRKK